MNILFELRSLKAIKKALLDEMPQLKPSVTKQRRKTLVIERAQPIEFEESSESNTPSHESNENVSPDQQPQSR